MLSSWGECQSKVDGRNGNVGVANPPSSLLGMRPWTGLYLGMMEIPGLENVSGTWNRIISMETKLLSEQSHFPLATNVNKRKLTMLGFLK